ncbi:MAG TPA: hypothetical protein VGF95_14995 [Solirubrobacteraceae bacterium]
MRKARIGLLLATVALCAGVSASQAFAAKSATLTVAKTSVGSRPAVFVDAKGTINVLWSSTAGEYFTLKYARKPAGAKGFAEVTLPNVPDTDGETPFIYEPSSGVLEIILTPTLDVYGWRSTDDGASWTSIDASGLNALRSQEIYVSAELLKEAQGGPVEYAGSTGYIGPIVQLNDELTGATTLASTVEALAGVEVARSADGNTFVLAAPSEENESGPVKLPFQVNSGTTGSVEFPCPGVQSLAAAQSTAVVLFSGCGGTWTRTISSGGAIGPLVKLGPAPNTGHEEGVNGEPFVEMIAERSGKLAAIYVVPGGDLAVAHSSDGAHWTSGAGYVPVPEKASARVATDASLSTGAADWLGVSSETGSERYAIELVALSQTYKPPAPPSGKGIPSAHHGSLGSIAAVAPGKIALKAFRKTGKVKVRVVSALTESVSAEISVSRTRGNTTTDICSAGVKAKLKAHQAKTITLTCAVSGVFVIGGGSQVSTKPTDAKKGDAVAFAFANRNGSLAIASKLG